jgi:hypothetical protein
MFRLLTLICVLGALLISPLSGQDSDYLTRLSVCYAGELEVTPPWQIDIKFSVIGDYAETAADSDYHEAEIYYDMSLINELSDKEIRETVIHELWHLVLWELGLMAEETNYDYALTVQEQQATHAARLLADKYCMEIRP